MARLFLDQLTVIDCGILDAQRGLIGQSWIVDVELQGELDAQGMVFDFGPAKKRIKNVIDEIADHKLLVPARAPTLSVHSETKLEFDSAVGLIEHSGPAVAICLIEAERIDTDSVATRLREALLPAMPTNVTEVELNLRQERIEGAYYSYCHGLKKHAGNCQRIAHGHRSRIEIYLDGRRSNELEQVWTQRWRDIYLGSREDLASAEKEARYRFRYTSAEGEFELTLPAERCALLETDSTVECIAEHICRSLKTEISNQSLSVRAFEGVNKGAVYAC